MSCPSTLLEDEEDPAAEFERVARGLVLHKGRQASISTECDLCGFSPAVHRFYTPDLPGGEGEARDACERCRNSLHLEDKDEILSRFAKHLRHCGDEEWARLPTEELLDRAEIAHGRFLDLWRLLPERQQETPILPAGIG